jgi:deoxyribodipyrimidine photo-lyase
MSLQVVWFKRDLRLHDHAALHHAAASGPVLCLYAIEPSIWAQPDVSNQHYQFILESLRDLNSEMRHYGGQVHAVCGEVTTLLAQLHAAAPIATLHSHEETGNNVTFQRDLAVARWCREHGVAWHEHTQFGVIRRLKDRNLWQAHWQGHANAPRWPTPALDVLRFAVLPLQTWMDQSAPSPQALGLAGNQPPHRQTGGRRSGLAVLKSFLESRSAQYRGGISSPLSAPSACSRLSPYLAYGCLSLREVVQATRRQTQRLPTESGHHKRGLTAFTSRLFWHCHFIQKLESEPELEWRNVHRGYDGLREPDWDGAHFDALVAGRTGWPMVDACVVMLRETGWINFRMRAMLVSVAAYPLWLHWRDVGLWLARQFLDYEPGIHWSQMQMQSGTTGINTTRVYNPIKQAQDHDPQGHFVRRWLPAMRKVPDAWLFEPWKMPSDLQQRYGVQVGVDIAMPLVDLEIATRSAKQRLHALRAQPKVRAAKAAIVAKHGSRQRRANPRTQTKANSHQLGLEFE